MHSDKFQLSMLLALHFLLGTCYLVYICTKEASIHFGHWDSNIQLNRVQMVCKDQNHCYFFRTEVEEELRAHVDELMREELKNLKMVQC